MRTTVMMLHCVYFVFILGTMNVKNKKYMHAFTQAVMHTLRHTDSTKSRNVLSKYVEPVFIKWMSIRRMKHFGDLRYSWF